MRVYMPKKNKFYILVFFIAGIIAIPSSLSSAASFFNTSIRLFSLALLSSLAASFLLFNYIKLKNALFRKKCLSVSLFLFIIIAVMQFFIFDKSSFNNFFFSIFWISVPLLIYLFSNIAVKYIPIYIYILWVLDLLISFYTPGEKVGITGNRNWHAIFLIVALLFSIYLTCRIIKYLKIRRRHYFSISALIACICLITAILACYTAYLFYMCDSRAATLAGIIMLLIFLYLVFIDSLKVKLKKLKLRYYLLSCSVLIISIIVIILFSIHYSRISETPKSLQGPHALLYSVKSTLNDDVRIPLWEGSLNLIKDYPFIGTSPARFESVFASYRPLEYFTKPNNAVRSNHPHNTLLYIAASFGLPALILWFFLWIYPMIYCFISYAKLTVLMRITLFAYFCLFFHGLLDLVLFHWPTIYLAAIFLGLLWNETWRQKAEDCRQVVGDCSLPEKAAESACRDTWHVSNRLKILMYVTASLILAFTLYNVYSNAWSAYFFGTGDYYAKNKKDERALFQYQKGLAYKKEPKYIYKAGMLSITSLKNPELALHFFSYFNKISTYDYAHKNGFIALSLVKLGKNNLTLPYLMKEVINYPLSVGAWFRLSLIQKQLKMDKAADFSLRNMRYALSAKELPPNALELIIKNPKYDSHPDSIPKEILDKLQHDSNK